MGFCALIVFLESFSAVPLFIKRTLEQTQCAAVSPLFHRLSILERAADHSA
jgi:hypothetical protein